MRDIQTEQNKRMENKTMSKKEKILAEIYLWEETPEIRYWGWRILDLTLEETIHGCSGYESQYDALDAMNRAIEKNRQYKNLEQKEKAVI